MTTWSRSVVCLLYTKAFRVSVRENHKCNRLCINATPVGTASKSDCGINQYILSQIINFNRKLRYCFVVYCHLSSKNIPSCRLFGLIFRFANKSIIASSFDKSLDMHAGGYVLKITHPFKALTFSSFPSKYIKSIIRSQDVILKSHLRY